MAISVKELGKNMLLLIASIGVSLLLAEAAVRLWGDWSTDTTAGRDFYTESWWPDVPYLMEPGVVKEWGLGTVRTGPLGLRDARPLAPRRRVSRDGTGAGEGFAGGEESDELRVLVLGDSIVEGFGVDQEETLPRRLEAHLTKRLSSVGDARRVRVVNGGIAGFSAEDQVALLRQLLVEVQPDLVVWVLIYNDYDDPLRPGLEGLLDSSPIYRLAIVTYLRHLWGVGQDWLDLTDLRRSMAGKWRRWADRDWREASALEKADVWLRRSSYLYSMVALRLATPPPLPIDRPVLELQPELGRAGILASAPDRLELAPLFSSIFESPRLQERFFGGVEEGFDLLEEAGYPTAAYFCDLPDWRQVESRQTIAVRDVTAILGQSFTGFLRQYGLGWDGHPNADGLEVFAQAIDEDLARLGWAPAESPVAPAADRAAYWQAVEEARSRFLGAFGPMLEIKSYQGIHQLVGGLAPPRIFPWHENALFALVVRGSGESRFLLEVERLQPMRTELEIRFGHGDSAWVTPALIRGPEFRVELELPAERWPEGVWGFLDIEVRCLTDPCPRMRIDRVGLEPSQDPPETIAGKLEKSVSSGKSG